MLLEHSYLAMNKKETIITRHFNIIDNRFPYIELGTFYIFSVSLTEIAEIAERKAFHLIRCHSVINHFLQLVNRSK